MNRHHHGLILAGGRGTRFWPRSRRKTAKQVLNVVGDRSLIQAAVARNRLRVRRVSARLRMRNSGSAAGPPVSREARAGEGAPLCGRRKLLLELRYVLLAHRRAARPTSPPPA